LDDRANGLKETKEKNGSDKMQNEITEEIKKAAEILEMSLEDAQAKFDEICSQNNVNPEQDALLARGLWRQYFSSVRNAQKNGTVRESSGGLFKKAFGYFISLEDARDMMAMQRDRIVNEYRRDADMTFTLGKVAIFRSLPDGTFEGRMMKDSVESNKIMKELPNNHVEIDSGHYIVPLDSVRMYGTNPNANFGKPLPKEEYRRGGVFIGEVDGKKGKYFFNYKGISSKYFAPKTFQFVHFLCIVNSNDDTKIHGGTNTTLESLVYNADLNTEDEEYVDTSSYVIQDEIMELSVDNYSPLVDLDRYHSQVSSKIYPDRFVFTDGNVTAINMTPTKNGNRILTLDDLNTDFDFESDGWSGTTCWIPEHIDIDFGIGSNVIIVGRTSQSTDDMGNLQSPTINVNGIFVLDARGGSPEKIDFVEEETSDWFFD
tara:strand:- start:803 stop:2092 length:1290 start_codon:yes stop_codon:yes gene_type:complete